MDYTQMAVHYVLENINNWSGEIEFYLYGENLEFYDEDDIRRGSYSLQDVDMDKFFATMEILEINIY